MDLTVNRHDNLATLSAIILVLSALSAIVCALAAFVTPDWTYLLYSAAIAINGWLISAVLEWMRSVYVSLYNLNRLAQKQLPTETPQGK